jgi:hypothetical protein
MAQPARPSGPHGLTSAGGNGRIRGIRLGPSGGGGWFGQPSRGGPKRHRRLGGLDAGPGRTAGVVEERRSARMCRLNQEDRHAREELHRGPAQRPLGRTARLRRTLTAQAGIPTGKSRRPYRFTAGWGSLVRPPAGSPGDQSTALTRRPALRGRPPAVALSPGCRPHGIAPTGLVGR